MSPAAALRAQLASIMEVLANAAVAEICELVDGGFSQLRLELTESRRENEALRRRLRLLELRAGRTSSSASSAVMLRVHHHGNEARRSQAPGGEAAPSTLSNQEALRRGDADLCSDSGKEATLVTPAAGRAAELKATVIKEEDDEESWCPSEPREGFGRVADGQVTQTEAPPPLIKQEAPGEGGGSSQSWLSGEVGSVPKTLNASSRDCLMYEPQLQHGSLTTQNPLSEDPGCSYAPSVAAASDSGSGGFPFAVSEVSLSVAERLQPAGFQESQQRAPLPAEEPRLPARKEVTQRQNAAIRRDRRAQDGANGASGHGSEGGEGKTFVCNCCGKTLACLKNLKTHMRVHTGEKPFVCALCGKRFSDSSNLKRHQSVHTGEKRYGCVHCGKRFAQSGSLKVHMTVHTDCKQFRCSFCGKTFISGSHLRRHVTVHARERRFAPTFQ